MNGSCITFYSIYLPGGISYREVEQYYKNDLKILTRLRSSYFIIGDFNSRHQSWSCFNSNLAGRILFNFGNNNAVLINHPQEHTYHPTDPNRNSSTLDLCLTNGLHPILDSTCHTSSSDHNIIMHTIEQNGLTERPTRRKIPCFKAANWQKYQDIVNQKLPELHMNIETPYESTDNLEEAIKAFSRVLLEAQAQSVPLVSPNMYGITLTRDIKDLITYRNTIVRQSHHNDHTTVT